MTHWASQLIGKPWAPNAEGPDAFDCWGLVRWVFREQHSIDMPPIQTAEIGPNVAAIKRAAEVSGWRRTESTPAAGDIMLMAGPDGRHVGVLIQYGRDVRLLHADGAMVSDALGRTRATGSVRVQRIDDALFGRYSDVELWRHSK